MVCLALFVSEMSVAILQMLWLTASSILLLMLVTWLVSITLKDVSIVDVIWGLGFVVVVWMGLLRTNAPSDGQWILTFLVTAWGLRLSAHLFLRNHGKPEDFRYRAMRDRWAGFFPLVSLFTVFGLQAAVMWLISLPIQLAFAVRVDVIHPLFLCGIGIWLVGMFFEVVADLQLTRFKRTAANQGKVLDTGLWRYSRHPNYFGESVLWWGLFLASVALSGCWWTVISPILMTFLLLHVSGVSLLEKTLKHSRPGYDQYISRTNAFWPGPPRH